jgi:hypothetical protein
MAAPVACVVAHSHANTHQKIEGSTFAEKDYVI